MGVCSLLLMLDWVGKGEGTSGEKMARSDERAIQRREGKASNMLEK